MDQGTIIEYPYNQVPTQLRLKQVVTNKNLLLQFLDLEEALMWKTNLGAHLAFYEDTKNRVGAES